MLGIGKCLKILLIIMILEYGLIGVVKIVVKFYHLFFLRKKNLLKKNSNVDQNYSDLQGRLDSTGENQYDHLRNVVYENSLN